MAQLIANGEDISEEIQTLANGPFLAARKCNSYTIDGYKFHTNSYDQGRPNQSSGVALVSQILSSTSEDNENLMVRNKIYYNSSVAFWKTEAGKVRCKKIFVHIPTVFPNLQFIESIFVAT